MRLIFLAPMVLAATTALAQNEKTDPATSNLPSSPATTVTTSPTSTNSGGITPLTTVGYKDNGGGFYLASPDENVKIGMQGYVQALQKNYASSAYDKYRPDYPLDFLIKRARLDFFATFGKNYDVFIEIDGAPTTQASGPTSKTPDAPTEVTNGIGMVEARVGARLVDDHLKLTLGKYIMPFSAENARSSRAYDTVERYIVYNTMQTIPALDAQYGAMLSGKEGGNAFEWYVSVVNGNAKAARNTEEDNGGKEFSTRVVTNLGGFSLGVAYDTNANAAAQTMKLNDLTGTTYNSARIQGRRQGWSPNLDFKAGDFAFRSEFMSMHWKDTDVTLKGGFAQVGYFIIGDDKGGFQPLVRWEQADLKSSKSLAVKGADSLQSTTMGWQWFINGNTRDQFNVVMTDADHAAPGTPYAAHRTLFAVLNEVQVKF